MMRELVRRARSIRRFAETERISEAALRELVDLARLTPSAANLQKLRYRIVSDPQHCAALFPCLAWAGYLKEWGGPAEGERPTGYVVILSKGEAATTADTGIAAQTIQLAAAEMGYGACMLGSLQRDRIKQVLNLPAEYHVNLVIALGRPAEQVVIEEVPSGADLKYYRTPDQVHHVPKLRLKDVLV
jgi:nitroreductase